MADYIKREDVHLAFDNYYFPEKLSLRETINSVPSVDVIERKKGKWINSKCSECGEPIPISRVMLRGKVVWERDQKPNFCLSCGANMREEKMTNKEWMVTLTAEQFYNKMMNLIYNYGFKFDNTRLAIINWLDEPHESEEGK